MSASDIMRGRECPYCSASPKRVTGREIYPHRKDLYSKVFWQCSPCDAYVGCHPNTDIPLGRLANGALRKAKSAAHRAFDPLWRDGTFSRSQAYRWLATMMGINAKRCHIGMFDEDMCKRVVALVSERNELGKGAAQ